MAKRIECMFQLTSNEKSECNEGRDLYFYPVTDEAGEEYRQYWEFTPSGSLELTSLRSAIAADFKPGTYRVTIEPVEG